jgi:hypothetical protein
VAVGGRLVEVGEQFGAPVPEAVGEGGEGGELCALGGGEEAIEPALGLVPVGRAVDLAESLLESPGLGDRGLALEQCDQPPPLALGQPLAGLE